MATQTRNAKMLELVDDAIEALLTGKQEVRRGARSFQHMTLEELQKFQQRYEIAVAREEGRTVQQIVMRRRVYTPRAGRQPWTR